MRVWAVCLLLPMLAGCAAPQAPFDADLPLFEVQSRSFVQAGDIPVRHTCDGEETSPPLVWRLQPEGTTHFALTMKDRDADGFVHWTWWDLPASQTAVVEGANMASGGAIEGQNSAGQTGYVGPCPPSGEHRYVIKVYALDAPLGLPAGANIQSVEAALTDHAVAKAVLSGDYRR